MVEGDSNVYYWNSTLRSVAVILHSMSSIEYSIAQVPSCTALISPLHWEFTSLIFLWFHFIESCLKISSPIMEVLVLASGESTSSLSL